MVDRVYNSTAVTQCAFDDVHKKSFDDILHKDYPGKEFGFSERILRMECVDMDSVEKSGNGSPDRTMDCVSGVSDYNPDHKSYGRHRLIMVEMKLGCKGFSLKPGSLEEKTAHTSDLLSGMAVDVSRVFLFPRQVISEAKRRLSQWKRGTGRMRYEGWSFLEPKEFNAFIHFAEDYPYQLKTDAQEIGRSLETAITNSIDSLRKCREYWLTMALKYENLGIPEESNHIRIVVKKKIEEILAGMPEGDDRMLLAMECQVYEC